MNFWDPVDIEPGCTLFWQIGTLNLWVHKTEHELSVYHEETDNEPAPLICAETKTAPPDVRWHRWTIGQEKGRLRLKPVMPDRPVVVRPENDLTLCVGAEGVFYARIPFWIAVLDTCRTPENLLCEIPAKSLSNTWFGPNTTTGSLCYDMQTSARRSLEGVEPVEHRALCPVKMKNKSQAPFDFTRVCIHTAHLNIYSYKNRLWTSRVDLTYRGEGKQDIISYNDNWFAEGAEAQIVSERKLRVEGKLFRRSLDSLKSLSNVF